MLGVEQATPLIQGTINHVQLATEAAADPQVVSSEGAPRLCAAADQRAHEVSELAR